MRCKQAKQLFSAWLDQELASETKMSFQQHLDSCPSCRRELESWQMLSRALKALRQDVAAPPGLVSGVMAELGRTHRRRTWWGKEWRKVAAAAAAVVVVTGSSLGWAVTNWLSKPGGQVAEKAPQVAAVPGATPAVLPNQPEPPDSTGTAGNAGQSSEATPEFTPTDATPKDINDTAGKEVPATTGKTDQINSTPQKNPTPATGKPGGQILALSEPRTFLSKTRVITSTLLKLQVAGVEAAEAQALAAVRAAGGNYHIFSLQNGNEREVIRITVPRQTAAQLVGQLTGVGKTISQNHEQQDITDRFDETEQQYQALLAQRKTIADQEQLAQMESLIVSLEKQLSTWNKEAEQEVIMLWLETGK